MKIIMSITFLREEEKEIVKCLRENNIEVEIMTEKKDYTIDFLQTFDLAIIRNLSQNTCLYRAKLFESLGIKTINSYNTIKLSIDKLFQSITFSSAGVSIPNFGIIFPETNYNNLINRFNDSFVIKPISASWGRGIVKIQNQNDFELWKETLLSLDLKAQSFPYLAQEYIEKENYDIRIVIVGKEVVGIFKRKNEDNWKTNTHLGAEVIPMKITEDIKIIVQEIMKYISPGIIGIDLLFDNSKNEYVLCEINNNPEFANSSKIYNVDIPKKITEYILKEVAYV